MSEEIHVEEHTSPIKTPKQLIIVVVLSFVVPVGVIATIASLVVSSYGPVKGGPGMTEEAIAKRIQPVGEVAIDPNQPKPEAAAPPLAAAPAPAAVVAVAPAKGGDAAKGKSVYDSACMACHAAGVAGAPKTGDKTAWAPRLNSGMDVLYTSSIKGKNAMPPKGGNLSLTDAEVKAAVDYMVGLSR